MYDAIGERDPREIEIEYKDAPCLLTTDRQHLRAGTNAHRPKLIPPS